MINPVIVRHARTQFRMERSGPLVVLALYLLLLVLAFFLTYMLGSYNGMTWKASIKTYWYELFAIQVFALIIIGSLRVAGTVVREKQNRQFDFQIVTGMSPWRIAEGEMVGSALFFYFLILCSLPFGVLCVLGGGIGWELFGYSYLLLFTGAFLFHSWALLASAVSRTYAGAIIITLLVLAIFSAAALLARSESEVLRTLSTLSPFHLPFTRLTGLPVADKFWLFDTPFPWIFAISAAYFFLGLWALNGAVRKIRSSESPFISKFQAIIFIAVFFTVVSGMLVARLPGPTKLWTGFFYENTAVYMTMSFLILVVFSFVLSPSAEAYASMKLRRMGGFWYTIFGERSLFFVNLLVLFGVVVGVYFGVFLQTVARAPDLTKAVDSKMPLEHIFVAFFFVLFAALFYSLIVQLCVMLSRKIGREIAAVILLILVMLPAISELWRGAPETGFVQVFNPVAVLLSILPWGTGQAGANLSLAALIFYFAFCVLLGSLLYLKIKRAFTAAPALPVEANAPALPVEASTPPTLPPAGGES